MIDLNKLLEIWISRKDKFIKAAERAKRREDFFKDIKAIDSDNSLDADQKRVLKDSAAQKLSGSTLVTYEFLNYFYKTDHLNNFEISAATVAFWGSCVDYYEPEEGALPRLVINKINYWGNFIACILTISFIAIGIVFFSLKGGEIVEFLASSFHISPSVFGAAYCGFLFLLFCFAMFFFYLFIILMEVKSILK